MDSKPTRGTRFPLGQVQQNIPLETKSTSLKPTQRPLSVPNLKAFFNGSAPPVNDDTRNNKENAPSEYLPTAHVPPIRRRFTKKNTTVFRDPILSAVEEVDDGSAITNTTAERDVAAVRNITDQQLESLKNPATSSDQRKSIIASTQDIALAQPDATKDTNFRVIACELQTTKARNTASTHTSLQELLHVIEPQAQKVFIAANTADQNLNLSAPLMHSELHVEDAKIITDSLSARLKSPLLAAISAPVIHKATSSPELKDSLINKVRGLAKRQSNPALPVNINIQQVSAIKHVASQTSVMAKASLSAMPIVSEGHIVTAIRHTAPEPSARVLEAAIPDSNDNTTSKHENVQGMLACDIPMAAKAHEIPNIYNGSQAPALSATKDLGISLQLVAEEDVEPLDAVINKATSVSLRKSSLDDRPSPPDPSAPTDFRAVLVKNIQTNSLKSTELPQAPKEDEALSARQGREMSVKAANHPQPPALAPALHPSGTHHDVDNYAAIGMLGLKSVPSHYVESYHSLAPELHGVNSSKDEEAYDSYDEEDDYVTARSYRSNGETTNEGATTDLFPRWNSKARREVAEATILVESTRTQEDVEDEAMDSTMVADYADEIFVYLRQVEVKMLPNPFYMEDQNELQWSMRSVLMDWLVQVHSRCNLLPETLFITANFVDRFLSGKIVSLGKLQLVGATALFLAAKKEEINCPTLSEIVYMVDNSYSADELIKAERYMLNILKWELEFPGPMSFLRRISKADDYDLETRTLAKYFLEVTLMEERFIGSPCSFTAAASHCLARMMLQKGSWTPYHVYYSNYTYSQLYPLLRMLLLCVENPVKHHAAVYEKYTDKRFKRASSYVEVQMQRGFILPEPPTFSTQSIVDDIVAPYAMSTYSNPFNYPVASASSSGRVFSV